ncbi:glycosyltransferase [Winogradskya humida]|uniref:Erythromycin biosynthesis protein CIII-like C-terminal domain-containing protein n=1 Tax=Winogradskya humida TaxID=113566 RepID=A0ABQ4A2G9_9ACTN|nr:nucleotide disphospho-sugar-binding domain-containing protein [Actinoplanes humidus]GIE25050.1 hypothetical protein Ahu01nite_081520 [Actinoplanes humidus]
MAGAGAGGDEEEFLVAAIAESRGCGRAVPDRTAILTVPGFECGDLPENVHLIGVLPAEAHADWQPPAWWAELDGSRPVVVVTQGTVANHDLSQLVEPTLAGLADLDVTVVAALGGQDPGRISIPVPGNARVAGFIPFHALLPKAAVLVTNGGASGTQQALAAGVPVVVAGATEDKPIRANVDRLARVYAGHDPVLEIERLVLS